MLVERVHAEDEHRHAAQQRAATNTTHTTNTDLPQKCVVLGPVGELRKADRR